VFQDEVILDDRHQTLTMAMINGYPEKRGANYIRRLARLFVQVVKIRKYFVQLLIVERWIQFLGKFDCSRL